ncbi:MAG: response regulator [Daejeonella sp.]|uniref:response regulator n=1 Tax=Daejeonella sp. TaxID=2805397 RepID=UPI003C788BFB
MKKKILIIDDDQDILDLTEFLLQEIGYKVVASLTANILDDVLQVNPDLILLDDWLESTSGHQLCKVLKTEQATKHIPVVIFSASTGLEKIAKDCFADDYINKPFDINYLQDVIADLLQSTSKASLNQ